MRIVNTKKFVESIEFDADALKILSVWLIEDEIEEMIFYKECELEILSDLITDDSVVEKLKKLDDEERKSFKELLSLIADEL